MTVLALVEHDRGSVAESSGEALTAARRLAAALGTEVHAVFAGGDPSASAIAGTYGAAVVHHLVHDLLSDYGPAAWGAALAELVGHADAVAVVATGSDRGNEVVAHVGARLDLPFVANCTSVEPGRPWTATRQQWGGSLLEDVTVEAPVVLLTTSPHAVEPEPSDPPTSPVVVQFVPDLDPAAGCTVVADRDVVSQGITLATAPVVVGGGRGVGSPEGFAPLEELADLVGGVVGCSRAVTNNGWRPHSDQVGQTGTRIAPELYVAAGISGAIQHWVGAAASKHILAINTDPEANMVARAEYAVIGDLHEVVPAISAEIRRRRDAGGTV